MGMFDDVIVECALPEPAPPFRDFQTKDLDNLMSQFVITAEGRLVEKLWDYEAVPQEELHPTDVLMPLRKAMGTMRRVPGSIRLIDRNYHGDIRFYNSSGEPDGEWFEYVARFTEGQLSWIKRVPES